VPGDDSAASPIAFAHHAARGMNSDEYKLHRSAISTAIYFDFEVAS
jgi:uncharacterized protein YfiM (DUF2279 family)